MAEPKRDNSTTGTRRCAQRWRAHAAIGAICLMTPMAAAADGEFFQFDYAPGASTIVGSMVRGPVGVALGWSDFTDGSAASATVTYSLPVPALGENALVRFGPSARLDRDDKFNLGAKVIFERWSPTDWGSVFILADYNTILNEYLLLGEAAHAVSGFRAAIAVQGGDNGYREQTLVLGYSIPDTPLTLRLGYRFDARQALIGFTINTF